MKKIKVNKGQKEFEILTVSEILENLNNGSWKAYDNNRGLIGVNQTRVKSIVECLNTLCLGAFHVSLNSDGSGYTTLDAHHRIAALLEADKRGLLTKKQLSDHVPVIIVSEYDAWDIYQGLNNSKGHTSKEKATNMDSEAGALLASLKDCKLIDIRTKMPEVVLDIMFATQQGGGFIKDVEDIFTVRTSHTKPFVNSGAFKEELVIKSSTIVRFNKFVVYLNGIQEALEKKYKVSSSGNIIFDSQSQKTLFSSPGLVMSLAVDFFSKNKLFTDKTPGMLVRSLSSKAYRLVEPVQSVSRRNKKKLKYDRIEDLLGG